MRVPLFLCQSVQASSAGTAKLTTLPGDGLVEKRDQAGQPRVRSVAGRDGAASSQDGVVEMAVERLYRDVRDQEEAGLWARASEDPDFRAEMKAIAVEYGDLETWPQ